jgi:hypothetical protein
MWQFQIDGSVVVVTWWRYLGLVILAGFAVRIVISGLREFELRWPAKFDLGPFRERPSRPQLPKEWWRSWWQGFMSTHESALVRDYWLPFILGLFELAGYPYFIAKGDWKVIGGWLALKTAAQWGLWSKSRSHYQRFLVGNAMVIAASVLLVTQLHISPR